MATFTETLPARKSSKHSAIQWEPITGDGFEMTAGMLTIDTDRARATYALTEFPADMPGRAFYLAKLTAGTDAEAESYSVFCSKVSSRGDICECRGYLRFGHCKHIDGCRALLANQWV